MKFKMALVVARFNPTVTTLLQKGTIDRLLALGVAEKNIEVISVPGAFEVPAVAKKVAETGQFHAVIALGVVIRGETSHFDFVAAEAAAGIAKANLEGEVPIIFGILTTENKEQALYRADPNGKDVGGYSAEAAIEMASLYEKLSLVSFAPR